MKKIFTQTTILALLLGLLFPVSSFARDRQEYTRDLDRDRDTEEPAPDNNNGDDGEDGGDGGDGQDGGGGTVTVTNSIVVSTHSGGNNEDGASAGDQEASVIVETIVNGESVQEVSVDDEELQQANDRNSQREDRRHYRYDDGDGVEVETDIEIINEEANDTGNQNNAGEDGEDGEDGHDGSTGEQGTSPEPEEEEEEEIEDGRGGDRYDRDARNANRGTVASLWHSFTNVITDVFRSLFA